jgi:hypothetical protein
MKSELLGEHSEISLMISTQFWVSQQGEALAELGHQSKKTRGFV